MTRIENDFPSRLVCALSTLGASALAVLGSLTPAHAQQSPPIDDPNSITHAPIVVCFADGTDPDYASQMQDMVALLNGSNYYTGSRWSGASGTPRALTWSLVPDGLSIPGGVGEATSASNMFAQMDSKFSAQGGRATWIARFQSCFDRWHQLTGLSFTRITTGGNDWDDGAGWGSNGSATRGDIRISMHAIDGVNNVLGYTEFPSSGDMVLDSAEGWGSNSNLHRFFRNTVMHELGHAFGINHVCSAGQGFLMEPFLATTFDGPQHDDIRGCERLYGDPFETDDTTATATDLGTIPSGTTRNNMCNVPAGISGSNPANTSICSIDANGEQDMWKFTVSASSAVSVTLTPLGFSYDNSAQTQSNPNCASSTSSTNSLTAADLAFEIRASNGVTVIATGNSAATGVAETLTNVSVPTGDAFIRVFESDSPTTTQLYKLSITVQNNCVGGIDCNSNGINDNCDIANGTSTDNNNDLVPDECEGFVGAPFCEGDQHDVFFNPCPCDNPGTLGHGCANSTNPDGALLIVTGQTFPIDTLHLTASGMPATVSAIYLKGDANITAGVIFGDGIRCVDGALIRLGTETNIAGASTYPTGAQQIVSIRGATPIGSALTAYYQTYYRNASAVFCPPETFNVSNGFTITW